MSRENRRRIDPEIVRRHRRDWLARLFKTGILTSVAMVTVVGVWWLNSAMRIESWSIDGPDSLQTEVELVLTRQKEQLDFVHAWPSHLRSELLKAIPDLADIRIARRLPDHLQLVAIPRQPVALWQYDEHVWLVDDQAHAYRPLAAGESPDLPLLRIEQDDLGSSVKLLSSLQSTNVGKLAKLSEVRADGNDWRLYFDRGELWLLPKQHTAQQLARLSHILSNPRWKNEAWRVDARASSRWYLRPASQGGVI